MLLTNFEQYNYSYSSIEGALIDVAVYELDVGQRGRKMNLNGDILVVCSHDFISKVVFFPADTFYKNC